MVFNFKQETILPKIKTKNDLFELGFSFKKSVFFLLNFIKIKIICKTSEEKKIRWKINRNIALIREKELRWME